MGTSDRFSRFCAGAEWPRLPLFAPVRAMSRSCRTGWFAVAAIAGVLCNVATASANPGDSAPTETIDAIWRIERFDFVYHSSDVFYSCGALQRKISAILRAVGAHARVAVEIRCPGGQLVRNAFASITLAIPTEANQENVRAATTFDTRAQLIARLRRTQLPSANDIQRFPASWQIVSLSRNRTLRLGPGDCDLLRGMRDQVFPKLSVRVASKGLRCSTGSATRIPPKIDVSALLPATPLPGSVAFSSSS